MKRLSLYVVLVLTLTCLAQNPNRAFIFEPLRQNAQREAWRKEPVLDAAYTRAKDAEDPLAAASVLAATAWTYRQDRPQEALSFFERALDMLHKTGLRNLDDRIITEVL